MLHAFFHHITSVKTSMQPPSILTVTANFSPLASLIHINTPHLALLIPLVFCLFVISHRSGSKLVLVGDPDQLPPVGYGFPLKDLLACGLIPQIILKEIFRQAAGSAIITSAYDIKEGRLPRDLWRWRVLPMQAAPAGWAAAGAGWGTEAGAGWGAAAGGAGGGGVGWGTGVGAPASMQSGYANWGGVMWGPLQGYLQGLQYPQQNHQQQQQQQQTQRSSYSPQQQQRQQQPQQREQEAQEEQEQQAQSKVLSPSGVSLPSDALFLQLPDGSHGADVAQLVMEVVGGMLPHLGYDVHKDVQVRRGGWEIVV